MKTKTKRALALLMLALLVPATMWAQSTFGGGSGTINDPYQMYNAGHFVQLADEVNAGNTFEGVYFKLTSSIDFRLYGQIPPIGGRYYTEDGTMGIRRFCGQFLGNNRTLYNLTITENPDQCGLFGCLGYGGLVMDLTIDGNSTITGIGDCGAIVGSAERNTNIINCTVGENVVVRVHPDAAGRSYFPGDFGGIVGSTSGIISSCVSKASISNSGINKATNLGGIAGSVSDAGQVENCYFLGSVEGTNTVGDIVGDNYGSITQCYYHTTNRHGAVNGADTDGAKWMGTVTMAPGVSGALPRATYTNSNTSYFSADKYMLLTLNYTVPDGYVQDSGQVSYMANDLAIGETESAGQPYYEFTMPAEDVTISAVVDLKRDIAYTPWVQIYIPSFTYTGEPLSPEAQVIDIKDDAQQTLTEGEHFTVTWPDEIIDAGEYTATINGIGDWAGSTAVTFSVEPAGSVARIVTHPTAIQGLTYNGQAQVLVTAGVVEGGVMLYRLENGEYSAELPTAISVGTYTVYYKAHSDDNHLDSSELSLVAQISQSTGTWEGEGTAEAPYLIKSVTDMNLIALKMEEMDDYSGVYFSLENDLDYTNAEQLPIGTSQRRFNGTFNGNGHTFTNMVINRPDDTYVAIFAVVDDNAVISDLHLGEGCAITGGTCVGGIAGLFSGTISDCTTAPGVNVKAIYKDAGGIVGRCVGTIERCVNQASVSADNSQAGGIAASAYYSSIRITDNLNLGSVTANKYAGGIVGYYYGIFSASQSPYTNNYYAGNCTTGAINGSDYNTMAQRGYAVANAPANLGAKGTEGEFITAYENGLLCDGKYYVASIGLYNAATNDDLLSELATKYESIFISITLQDRTLYRDGRWNTLCLPFAVENFTGTPLEGATVKRLGESSYDAPTKTLTLNFEDADAVWAGVSYLVKWTSGENIVNPVFSGVEILSGDVTADATDCADFIGCYSPVTLAAQDRTVLYLGGDSKLYYPSVDVPVNAFRGYFQLKDGLKAGDLPANGAKNIVLNFGNGETTGVSAVESGELTTDSWYSIDGRRLRGEPAKKGIYIKNGKKVIK